MIELIKRTLLTGVGLAVLTKEKVEELAKELAEQAKLSEAEGRELVDSLMQQSEAARNDLENRINGLVQKALSGLKLATQDDVAKLAAKVAELEAKISAAESKPAAEGSATGS